MKRAIAIMSCVVMLGACKDRPGQNDYAAGEAGISRSVEFGTVLNVREVTLHDKNTGSGALLGAGAGAAAGSTVGGGSGQTWAIIGTAVAGAIAGGVAEGALDEHKGLEYTLQMQSGEVKTIAQEVNEGDVIFKDGDKVMLQYCDGGDKSQRCKDSQYQRLLPVKKFPPYVKKKRMPTTHDVPAPELE